MRLQREIRVVVDAQGKLVETTNRWSGGPIFECGQTPLACSTIVSAPLDPDGVAVEVQELDQVLRSCLTGVLASGVLRLPETLKAFCQHVCEQLAPDIQLVEVSLAATARCKFTMEPANPSSVLVTQQFEFSAAHRLVGCSEEGWTPRNFGKCARVHGHNYVLDVMIREAAAGGTAEREYQRLEHVVQEVVLAKLDHRYLNEDVAEFKTRNPTVEQIAVVIWDYLAPHLEKSLAGVRLYETPKTWAEYYGPSNEPRY